jgi:AcrR family transcriptional regulator
MSLASIRRQHHRDQLIDAAEHRIATSGLASLKTRDLAHDIGVALGAIYNLVENLDELLLLVASRTLRRFEMALSDVAKTLPPATSKDEATTHLVAVALAYRRFASDNLNLWRMLFEHRMAPDSNMPDWALTEQMQLFHHIDPPLAILASHRSNADRHLLALTLFGAVHGVVMLALDGKTVGLPMELLDQQLTSLVKMMVKGLDVAD